MSQPGKKILLGMLVSNGDCLMATVLARQIKQDYPGCHLTWAISNLCRQVIDNNPYVDAVWEIPLNNKKEAESLAWYKFREEAEKKKQQGEFGEIFFTQIYPDNVHHYDGTTRGTVYNAYPKPITVNAMPVLRLYDAEVERVRQYATANRLTDYKHVILFECAPASGQSFVTPEFAMDVARSIVDKRTDTLVILSTQLKLASPHAQILIGNELSLRETAELTKYCSLLAGCSSGITWICSSDWAKPLPGIQFLNRAIGFRFASIVYDHKYWRLHHSEIIETTRNDRAFAIKLINDVLERGIYECKPDYHQELKPLFISMVKYCFMFFRRGQWGKSYRIARNFIRRNYKIIKTKGPFGKI